ncbi:MAG: hypothetical protein HYX62_04580 [Gammaproteobacteria bacterium]|nr:hypothetical protein [Gammaproteobacteria bacterium]
MEQGYARHSQGQVAKRKINTMGTKMVQMGQGRWSRYRISGSIHKQSGSIHKATDSLHSEFDSLHNNVLLEIAARARNQQRLTPKEMERILLELCRERWLTRNELASLVDRNAESLRQRFLNPMVEHGLLRLRHPDKPNRVDQAYTANALPDDPTSQGEA